MANTKMWQIRDLITCKTKFVVYTVECPCGKKYIGSTTCELKKRILEHTRATQNKHKNNAIAKHMEILHNSNWKLLKFYAIDHVKPTFRVEIVNLYFVRKSLATF